MSPSRAPVLSFAHHFQAPATQATVKRAREIRFHLPVVQRVLPFLRIASLRYAFLRVGSLSDASLRYAFLRVGSLRDAFLRVGFLRDASLRVAFQCDAFCRDAFFCVIPI